MPYWLKNTQTGEIAGGDIGISAASLGRWLDPPNTPWVVQREGSNGMTAGAETSSAYAAGPMISPQLIQYRADLQDSFSARRIDIDQYNAGINLLNSETQRMAAQGNLALGNASLFADLQGPKGTAASMELLRGSSGANGMQWGGALRGTLPSQYGEWNQEDLRPRDPRSWMEQAFKAAGMGQGAADAGGAGGANIGPGASVSVNGQQVAGQGLPTATGGTFDPSITSPANKVNPGIYQDYGQAPALGTYAYGATAPSREQMGAPNAESRDLTGFGYNRGDADDPIGNPRRYLETLAQMYPGTVVDPIDSEGNLVGPTWDAYGRPLKPDNYTGYWPRMPQDEKEAWYFEEWVKGGMEAMPAYEYPAPGETEEQFLERTVGTSKQPAWSYGTESAPEGQQAAAEAPVAPTAAVGDQAPSAPDVAREYRYQDGSVYRKFTDGRETLTGSDGRAMNVPGAQPGQLGAEPAAPGGGRVGAYGQQPAASDVQNQTKLQVPGQPVWKTATLPQQDPNPALRQDPNRPTGDPFFDAPRTDVNYAAMPKQPLNSGTNPDSGNTAPRVGGGRMAGNTPESRASGDEGGEDRDDDSGRPAPGYRALGGLDVVKDETRFEHGGQRFVVGEGGKDELVARTPGHLATYPLEQPGIPVPDEAADTANDLVPGSPYESRGGLPTPNWMKSAMRPDAARLPAGVSPETGEPLFLEVVTASGEPYTPVDVASMETGDHPWENDEMERDLQKSPIAMKKGGLVGIDPKGSVLGKKGKQPPIVPPTPPAPVPTAYALAPQAKVYAANKPVNLKQLDAATQQHYNPGKKVSTPKPGGKDTPVPGAEPVKARYINDAGQVQVPTGANKWKTIPAFENVGIESPNHWQASELRFLAENEDAMDAFRSILKAKAILPAGAFAAVKHGLGTQVVPKWVRSRAF